MSGHNNKHEIFNLYVARNSRNSKTRKYYHDNKNHRQSVRYFYIGRFIEFTFEMIFYTKRVSLKLAVVVNAVLKKAFRPIFEYLYDPLHLPHSHGNFPHAPTIFDTRPSTL